MEPEFIKYRLKLAGYTQSDIARMLGVSMQAVFYVIKGTSVSHRIKAKIAEIIGEDIDDIWPAKVACAYGASVQTKTECSHKRLNI